jgi:hypothetical protein
VVLANRFPLPDKSPVLALENRAYLVSLEGLQDHLPGAVQARGRQACAAGRAVELEFSLL